MRSTRTLSAAGVVLLTAGSMTGTAIAQEPAAPAAPAQTPATPPAQTPPPTLPTTTDLPITPLTPDQPVPTTPQPSGKTPQTTKLTDTPDTKKAVGIGKEDVKRADLFQKATPPGQPVEGDPAVIRTLDDALAVAFRRSPTILLAQERALRTEEQVNQILAIKRPQITAGGSYARLANPNSNAATGGGFSPSQIANPFPIGLTTPPPGSTPIQLSTTGISGGVGTGATALSSTITNNVSNGINAAAGVGVGAQGINAGGVGGVNGTGAATRAESTGDSRQTTGNNNNNNSNSNITRVFNTVPLNQVNTRIAVTQAIDITGLIRTVEQIGDLQEALTRVELARLRQQTALDVKNAYFSLLRATSFVRVNEAAVAQSEEQLRVIRAQETAGVASRFDVLRAQTQLDNNRQALISSRNQVAIAKNALANTIGVDPSTPVDPQPLPVPPLPTLDQEQLLQQALTQRPEYIQADLNLLLASKNIRLARRGLEPFLNASVSGNYNATPTPLTQNKATAALGLNLTVPLYDGGATRAAVSAARSDERGAEVQKDQYVRGIKAEVQQSIVAVNDANERSLSIVSTVAQAQEALRLANVRFRAGVGTQLDVNDAQTALIQAQTNQVSALFDYLGALARLQRAIGTPQ